MSAVGEFVAAAWRDGLGPDDRDRIARLIASGETSPAFEVFVALYKLASDIKTELPEVPESGALRVLYAAANLSVARLTLDPATIDTAIEHLGDALDGLNPSDPRGDAAQAWADLALGDLAVAIHDVRAARRRFEAVAGVGHPIALRITAMIRLAGLAMDRLDPEPARNWARKATALAESAKRPAHAARARIGWGLLDYMAGDVQAMRKTLHAAIDKGKDSAIARLMLAGIEKGGKAMQLLADGLKEAVEAGDPLGYTLCVLIGSRRYVTMSRDGDAVVTISAGIVQLQSFAPYFAQILVDERAEWMRTWGAERWAAAEKQAMALLEAATR
jgi:hypothetical protein